MHYGDFHTVPSVIALLPLCSWLTDCLAESGLTDLSYIFPSALVEHLIRFVDLLLRDEFNEENLGVKMVE